MAKYIGDIGNYYISLSAGSRTKKLNANGQWTLIFIVYFLFAPLLFANTDDGVNPFWPKDFTKQQKSKNQVELNSGPVVFKNDTVLTNRFNRSSSLLIPEHLIVEHNKVDIINLNSFQTPGQVKNVNLLGSLAPNLASDFNSENEAFWKKIDVFLDLHRTSKIKEVGFLKNHFSNGETAIIHVGKWQDLNNSKYILNFDGGELIYFDPPLKDYSVETNNSNDRFVFYKTRSLFSNEGKVLLTKSTKNVIMDNSINKAGILEANHISVVDNYIILDIKEVKANSFEQINSIIGSIKMRPRAQKSQNLLKVVWKPRKNNKNN